MAVKASVVAVASKAIGFSGEMVMDCKGPLVTVNDVDPVIEPDCTVIVVFPAVTPVTSPEALTVATLALELFQVRPEVSVLVLPSSNVPVATNCTIEPTATVDGLMVIDCNTGFWKKP